MARLGLAIVLLAVCGPVLYAQSTSASLTGRVTDPSKARIVDAKVTAISGSTNVSYDTTTNTAGEYYFSNLPPDSYHIEVEKAGFKKLIRPDVVLRVQDALEIDIELSVGRVTDNVIVEGGAPLVNTESATVSTVVDRTFADNLPLNGRSFQTLILLTPGVIVTQTANDDQGQFSMNGQRADGNYFTVDGVSANFGVTGFPPLMQSAGGALPALTASGGTNSLVSVDAMQEFRIQTSSFAPEFGRTPGGQVSIVTRSGTNTFHGTLFEYFRNDVLDANDWFSDLNHLPKPAERQNDFGGVLGGAVIRDKSFFFSSYEGLRLQQPATEETVVPDATSRQAQTPAGTAIRPYLDAYPVANGAELGSGLAQFNAGFSNPSSLDAYSLRMDQIVSSHASFFGRYDYSPSNSTQRGPSGAALSTAESLSSSVQTLTLGLSQSIRPRVANELRLNYSNDRVGSRYSLDRFGGSVPPADSILFPSGFSSSDSFFELIVLGAGSYTQGKYGIDEQRQISFLDNVAITRGVHQLKFGVDYRWLSPFSSPLAYGQFAEFSGMSTTPGGALSGTALVAESLAIQSNALFAQNFSLYGQDIYRITPSLTLTYGLRWDINPPLRGKNAANDPFTLTGLNDLSNPSAITLAPRGTPLYQTTYGNVAPRAGIAYQLRNGASLTTVVRVGFGTFYDLGYGSLGGVSSYFPYEAVKLFAPAEFPLTPQDAAPPTFTINPPVPTIIVADPHLKLPRTYEWNVAVEQALGGNQSLSWTYIGAIGRDLLRATDLSNANPNFGLIALTGNTGTSNYQALQVKFQRRMSRGLQALGSYTFSHSIDNASTDVSDLDVNTPGVPYNPNIDRGNSSFDVRHSFTAGVSYAIAHPGSNDFARSVFGGWSVDSFLLVRSAPPVDLIGATQTYSAATLYFRPDVIPGEPLVLRDSRYPGGKIFNGAAFSAPLAGQQGDFGRNVLRGFGATQADVAFQKQFHINEKVGLRFRGEFFNIFNHPNFGPPDNNITDALFGYSTETLATSLGSGSANGGLNPLYQIGGPRSIQLAAKLQF
jgi:hypothetical protein